jgi:hypothetical protein
MRTSPPRVPTFSVVCTAPAWSRGAELGDQVKDAEVVAEPKHDKRLGVFESLVAGGFVEFGASLFGHSHCELCRQPAVFRASAGLALCSMFAGACSLCHVTRLPALRTVVMPLSNALLS